MWMTIISRVFYIAFRLLPHWPIRPSWLQLALAVRDKKRNIKTINTVLVYKP